MANPFPVFPDVHGSALWSKTKRLDLATRWAARSGQLVAAALVVAGIVMMFGRQLPLLGGGFVQGLWLVLIGWFLNAAALRRYAHTISKMRQFP